MQSIIEKNLLMLETDVSFKNNLPVVDGTPRGILSAREVSEAMLEFKKKKQIHAKTPR
jgi:hypothetical protein